VFPNHQPNKLSRLLYNINGVDMPFVKNTDALDGGNGNAADADDFVRSKLAAFITSANHFPVAANRWVRSRADDIITGSEAEVWLTPPTQSTPDLDEPPFMAFHTKADGIFCFPGDGFSGTEPAYDQPGGPGAFPIVVAGFPDWKSDADGSGLNPQQEIPSITAVSSSTWIQHHLFAPADGRYCHAAMETGTRIWRHIMFGNMIKFGGDAAWDGGEYCCGHRWSRFTQDIDKPYDAAHMAPWAGNNRLAFSLPMNSVFRAIDLQGALEWWTTHEITTSKQQSTSRNRPSGNDYSNVNQSSGAQILGGGFANGLGRTIGTTLFTMPASLISGAKPLIPIYVGIFRDIGGIIRFCPLGQIPDVFRISMKGFSPADEVTIGSDTYTLIPIVNSDVVSTIADDQYSGYEGLAYRQIP